MWGTATLILLLAFGMGFSDQMMLNFRGMGDRIAIIFNGNTSQAYAGMGIGRRIQLRESDAVYLKQEVPGIDEISPEFMNWNTNLRFGDRSNVPNIGGVHVNYGNMRNIFPQDGGRWINPIDVSDRRRVIFLGDKLAELLFADSNPVGQTVMIGESPFTVIGVMQRKSQNSSYSHRDESRAFIPATTFATMFGTDRINNIIYTVESPVMANAIRDQIREALARKHRYNPDDRDATPIWDTNETWEFFFYFFVAFNGFLGIIGFFTLAVGGIGVANIMFVVVQERTREIGIRRAAGAKRSTIMIQFFSESFLLVAFGAALGYGIGWSIIGLLQNNPLKEYIGAPVFTPEVGIIAFAVLSLIGLVAGFMPAARASRLDIVECLRS
jgi:putative ABC transport system permease protein